MSAFAQFRQIGVPDARQTNAEVRECLRRAQRRTETILNRSTLPRAPALLNALTTLQGLLLQAYAQLPMRRFTLLSERLGALYDAVERSSFFGTQPNGVATATLRSFYQDVTGLLQEMQLPVTQPKPDVESERKLQKFLTQAARRGWRVPDKDAEKAIVPEQDGFSQSVSYVQKVSVDSTRLLQKTDDFGITDGAILLLTEQPIPESVLLDWTRPPLSLDVYVVFGNYIVLTGFRFLGLRPCLALTQPEKKPNPRRFITVANYLDAKGALRRNELIQYPRRVSHHYYCPVMNIPAHQRPYFRVWDLLAKDV